MSARVRRSALASMLTLGVAALVLGPGMARAQEMVADRYELRAVDAPDAADGLARCTGRPIEEAQAFLRTLLASADADKARQFGAVKDPANALLARGQWACIPLSLARYPEWPVEGLASIVHLTGADPAATQGWMRNLLEQVARSGLARGLVVYANGNAEVFELKAEQGFVGAMSISMRTVKAGNYDEGGFHAVIKDPGLKSITTSSRNEIQPAAGIGAMAPGGRWSFMLPMQRLRWPQDGEFVRVAGSARTALVATEGTRWATATGTRLWLQPGGLVVYSTTTSTDSGTWTLDGGVLHVSLAGGSRLALNASADGKSLVGRARRQPPPSSRPLSAALEGIDMESQWTLRLDKQ